MENGGSIEDTLSSMTGWPLKKFSAQEQSNKASF